jgi:hypothetical protein
MAVVGEVWGKEPEGSELCYLNSQTVTRTPESFNVRFLKLWQATTEEDPYLEARDGLGDRSKKTE